MYRMTLAGENKNDEKVNKFTNSTNLKLLEVTKVGNTDYLKYVLIDLVTKEHYYAFKIIGEPRPYEAVYTTEIAEKFEAKIIENSQKGQQVIIRNAVEPPNKPFKATSIELKIYQKPPNEKSHEKSANIISQTLDVGESDEYLRENTMTSTTTDQLLLQYFNKAYLFKAGKQLHHEKKSAKLKAGQKRPTNQDSNSLNKMPRMGNPYQRNPMPYGYQNYGQPRQNYNANIRDAYSSQGGLYSNQRRPDKNNLLQLQKEAIKVLNDEKNLKIKKDQWTMI